MILDRLKKLKDVIVLATANPGVIALCLAGGITVGAATFIYQYYQNRQNPHQHNDHDVPNNIEGEPEPVANNVCDFCHDNYGNNETYTLGCGHSWHDDCLLTNSLLQNLDYAPFGKCHNNECNYRITINEMKNLFAIFRSRHPNAIIELQEPE